MGVLTAAGNTIAATQTTASAAYTDLATVGPAVSVATRTSALIVLTVNAGNTTTAQDLMGYAISGATTLAASDNTALNASPAVSTGIQGSAVYLQSGLTPGLNTFTAKYRTSAGTATFLNRSITVIPLSV